VTRAPDQAGGVVARANFHLSEQVEPRSIRQQPFATLARWLRIPARFVIEGPSMLPTLEPGDHVLIRRTKRLREGQLVVLSDPELPLLVVKRVVSVDREGIEVVGDNPGASRDSKDFGLVPHANVLGIVWYRHLPFSRVGRVR
jgi:nickel-type superoxide dismutase maturation protease